MNEIPNEKLKSDSINVRLKPTEKARLNEYCKNNDIKSAQLLRKIINEITHNSQNESTYEVNNTGINDNISPDIIKNNNKKSPKLSKSDSISVRLNSVEKDRFNDYCRENDITSSRYLRKIIREVINTNPDLLTIELVTFKDAVRQLSGISRNLNQLTRAVNSGKIPHRLTEESYFNDLKSHVNDIKDKLNGIIDVTINRWVV